MAVAALTVFLGGCVEEVDVQDPEEQAYACLEDTDCLGGFVCAQRGAPYGYGVCIREDEAEPQPESCTNGIEDGDESDVDCGGSVCNACSVGASCLSDSDCKTQFCDGVVCERKSDGQPCATGLECVSGFCGTVGNEKICGTACANGACPSNESCVGDICIPDGQCNSSGPGIFIGTACDCSDQCANYAVCDPTDTGLTCTCDAGYEPDGPNCVDVDECARNLDDCDSNAACTNTDGSFSCACTPPWEGDGQQCSCPQVTTSAGPDQQKLTDPRQVMLQAEIPGPDIVDQEWRVITTFPPENSGTHSFDDGTSPTTLFSGVPNTAYLIEWWVYNGCSEAIDTVLVSFGPCNGQRELRDERDGTAYPIVPIGSDCWMGENLNIGMITSLEGQIDDGVIQKSCYGDVDSGCAGGFGGSYTRDEALQFQQANTQGVCPDGWRLPDINHYENLGGQAMGSPFPLLAEGQTPSATNELGFNGLLAGKWNTTSGWHARNSTTGFGYHWATGTCDTGFCTAMKLDHSGPYAIDLLLEEDAAASVRCVKRPGL